MATDCIPHDSSSSSTSGRGEVRPEHASSDGGAVLLKAVDRPVGVTATVARCLRDPRQPGKVQHEVLELVRQRIFGLICGYADCNDAARLADDPVHKLLLDRDPLDRPGAGLAGHAVALRECRGPAEVLTRLGHALADLVIAQHRARRQGRARRITIDFDPTDDPTHGQQEFTFFNGHYDTWCYLPLLGFVTLRRRGRAVWGPGPAAPGQQWRPSSARSTACGALVPEAAGGLSRRAAARAVGRRVSPATICWRSWRPSGVEYVVALGRNRRLDKRAQRLMGKARMRAKASGETEHLYGETRYAAAKWKRKRRVIIKAEVVCHPGRPPKNNPRFVVTNLPTPRRHVYEIYRARGDIENRIKELKTGLALDRMSCTRFWAISSGSCSRWPPTSWCRALRGHAAGTACATAQVTTLRERLLKVAVWVERSVRRIVLHLPTTFPWPADVAPARLRRRRSPGVSPRQSARAMAPGRRVSPRPCETLR